VTNRDIRSASVSDAIPLDISEAIYLATKIKVRKIMTPYPFTVSSEQTMEEAADMLLKNAISGAPVVDDKGDIVGVITRSDALRVLMSVVSGDKVGYQFAFSLSDRPGATSEIIKVVHNYNARIASILSSYQRVARGFRNVYMRVYDLEPDKLPQLLNELRGKFTVDYVVDFITNKREIYQK